ncbi:hypothetical protein A2U01_0060834, partial [Trifolium medium]|nr:hypothetical protein [Trifolium medium]
MAQPNCTHTMTMKSAAIHFDTGFFPPLSVLTVVVAEPLQMMIWNQEECRGHRNSMILWD